MNKLQYYLAHFVLLTLLCASCKSHLVTPRGSNSNIQIFPFQENGLWGYNKKDGTVLLPSQFEEAYLPNYGLARVKKNGKYGFISKEGKTIIRCKYDQAFDFKIGKSPNMLPVLAKVKDNGKFKYINQNGKKVSVDEDEKLLNLIGKGTPLKITPSISKHIITTDDTYELSFNYLIKSETGDTTNYIDTTNLRIDTVHIINNGALACKSEGKYGFVHRSQLNGIPKNKNPFKEYIYEKENYQPQINFIYDDLKVLNNTQNLPIHFYFSAQQSGQWGMVDLTGNQIIPFMYHSIESIEQGGQALVEYEKNKFGYVSIKSSSGEKTKTIYSHAEHFIR